MDARCIGEFPLLPGWLFTQELGPQGTVRIIAYGPNGVRCACQAAERDPALAACVRKILHHQPCAGDDHRADGA